MLKQIVSSGEEVFIIEGVSPQDLSNLTFAAEKAKLKFRLSDYDRQSLTLKIPSKAHERLHRVLDDYVYLKAAAIGLGREFSSVGSTRYTGTNNEWALEADSARLPLSMRPSEEAFPTYLIEAGYSQSLTSLKRKALLWFEKSAGEVKIVILAIISRPTQLITLELWTAVPDNAAPVRPGAMGTRGYLNCPRNDPRCVKTTTIRRIPGTNTSQFDPNMYSVEGGPLVLEFKNLFLRNPGPREHNIILDEDLLKEYAADVWKGLK